MFASMQYVRRIDEPGAVTFSHQAWTLQPHVLFSGAQGDGKKSLPGSVFGSAPFFLPDFV